MVFSLFGKQSHFFSLPNILRILHIAPFFILRTPVTLSQLLIPTTRPRYMLWLSLIPFLIRYSRSAIVMRYSIYSCLDCKEHVVFWSAAFASVFLIHYFLHLNFSHLPLNSFPRLKSVSVEIFAPSILTVQRSSLYSQSQRCKRSKALKRLSLPYFS